MAPAMATTAPTEMSIPPVAITSVMPVAMIMTGAAFFTMSTRLPNRWPSFNSRWKNPGVKRKSKSRMQTSVTRGQVRGNEVSRLRRAFIGAPPRPCRCARWCA